MAKTSSTHRSAFVQVTHRFDILGYSTLKSLGVRTCVRSGGFDAAGFRWALICRFDEGERGGRRGNIVLASISLELSENETDDEVVAMAGLRIDEAAGTGQFPAAVWRSDKAHTFEAWSSSAVAWELAVPAAFRDHEARYVDADADRLTIHCTVDVLQQDDDSTAGPTRDCFISVPPPPSIPQDFQKLLIRGTCLPDVTFIVEDTEIPAHRLVLAMRSSVFRAQFFHGEMKERISTARLKIKIDDMSARTFRAMLYFIYTDAQPKPKRRACRVAMAQDLLVAADLYDLERLRLMCEKTLSENLDVDNVMVTLMQIHGRHSCRQLEACCVEFLASNPDVYGAVEATEEYKELEKDCGAFINEVTKKVARRAVARRGSLSSSGSLQPPRTSVSRYNPNALARGRHEFVIENLSAVRQRHGGADDYVRSGTFQVGAYEWAIDVYPWVKGDEEGKEDVGIYLALVNAPTAADDAVVNVTASPCFRINNDPSPTFSHGAEDMSSVYTAVGQSFGWAHFATLESATSPDGSLTIHTEVQVISESRTSTGGACVGAMIIVPPTDLTWHLEQLLSSQHGSDVKFLVQQSEIHAHRLVIAARSLVLHTVVESAGDTDHVVINGMHVMAFKAVLHFIYTDELPRLDGLVVLSRDFMAVAGDMLAAACRFGLERMKRLCVNLLAEKVTTVSNALATVKVARRHNCPELEEYCKQYMSLPHVANKVTETCIGLFLESELV